MSKKFGKFLLFTAAVGAAGAAAYYYMQKKDAALSDESDDDYDDFSEDTEKDNGSRTYVPLNHDESAAAEDTADSADSDPAFTPLSEQASQTAENIKEKAEESVEEFFDDEDAASSEE